MKRAALALVIALGLTACATVDTSKWPDPLTLQTGLTVAEAAWSVYCGTQQHSSICKGNAAKVAAAEQAANDALAAYAQAYASGNVTQALLDNLDKAIIDVVALIASIKGRG